MRASTAVVISKEHRSFQPRALTPRIIPTGRSITFTSAAFTRRILLSSIHGIRGYFPIPAGTGIIHSATAGFSLAAPGTIGARGLSITSITGTIPGTGITDLRTIITATTLTIVVSAQTAAQSVSPQVIKTTEFANSSSAATEAMVVIAEAPCAVCQTLALAHVLSRVRSVEHRLIGARRPEPRNQCEARRGGHQPGQPEFANSHPRSDARLIWSG